MSDGNMGNWAKKTLTGVVCTVFGVVGSSFSMLSDILPETIKKFLIVFFVGLLIIGAALIIVVLYDYLKKVGEYIRMLHEIHSNVGEREKLDNFKKQCSEFQNDFHTVREVLEKLEKNMVNFERSIVASVEELKQAEEVVAGNCSRIMQDINRVSNFRYATTDTTKELKNLLDTTPGISEIHIICYGRSGYGDIVEHINSKNLDIKVKIIMCNPDENRDICDENDKEAIYGQIRAMLRYSNKPEIIVADIPPAIRASTVYIGDKPIWSVTQAYQLEKVNGRMRLLRPDRSFITVCSKFDYKEDIQGMVDCFETEFERLSVYSKIPVLKDSNIIFVDRQ